MIALGGLSGPPAAPPSSGGKPPERGDFLPPIWGPAKPPERGVKTS